MENKTLETKIPKPKTIPRKPRIQPPIQTTETNSPIRTTITSPIQVEIVKNI
jgi:hypothetical protein